MRPQSGGEASRRTVVEEDAQSDRYSLRTLVRDEGDSALRATNPSAEFICSRVTGYCSMISLIVIPASRLSKTSETGVRVPLNSQAPPTFPAMLSTAGQFDQSSGAAIIFSIPL